MLKSAFNSLTRIHSRPAQIRRLAAVGSPDIYSPCRLSPSNYFRFLGGPENTVVHGREFVIPIDTLLGQFSQTVGFAKTPTVGTFKLSYNSNDTTALAFNVSAANVQVALRLLAGLANVLVTGSVAAGFSVVFPGFSAVPLILVPTDSSTLLDTNGDAVTITATQTYTVWTDRLKRGDKIIDSVYGSLTIDEVIEMVDLGGAVMGFRVRSE